MVLPKISFFNVLKRTCLIILIQPPDLNEVFWLVYNILIPHCFCQKVSWWIMPEPNSKSLFQGLRGQLCCGFAGGLQLSIKVLPLKQNTHYTEQLFKVSWLHVCNSLDRSQNSAWTQRRTDPAILRAASLSEIPQRGKSEELLPTVCSLSFQWP